MTTYQEKLAELIKEDNLFENLLDYNLTAIVVETKMPTKHSTFWIYKNTYTK
jgi:hypothetical protein